MPPADLWPTSLPNQPGQTPVGGGQGPDLGFAGLGTLPGTPGPIPPQTFPPQAQPQPQPQGVAYPIQTGIAHPTQYGQPSPFGQQFAAPPASPAPVYSGQSGYSADPKLDISPSPYNDPRVRVVNGQQMLQHQYTQNPQAPAQPQPQPTAPNPFVQPQQPEYQQPQAQPQNVAPGTDVFDALKQTAEQQMIQANPQMRAKQTDFMSRLLPVTSAHGMTQGEGEKYLQDLFSKGYNVEQATHFIDSNKHAIQSKFTEAQDKALMDQQVAKQVLQQTWGQQFDANMNTIKAYADKTFQDETSKLNWLSSVLSNATVTQSTLATISGTQGVQGVQPGGQPLPGQPQHALPNVAGQAPTQNSVDALEQEWKNLQSNPHSDLRSPNEGTRQQAQKRFSELSRLIYKHKYLPQQEAQGGFGNPMF